MKENKLRIFYITTFLLKGKKLEFFLKEEATEEINYQIGKFSFRKSSTLEWRQKVSKELQTIDLYGKIHKPENGSIFHF